MQQANKAGGALLATASSTGRTSRATPVISIRFACLRWIRSIPRAIRPAPPVGTTMASVVRPSSGWASVTANSAKPSAQSRMMAARMRLITVIS